LLSLLRTLRDCARSRAALQLEAWPSGTSSVCSNDGIRLGGGLTRLDRLLWVWLPRAWDQWRTVLVIVKPERVIAWHRRGFRLFWAWKNRHKTGRPTVPPEVRTLIRNRLTINALAPAASARSMAAIRYSAEMGWPHPARR
jgi:putative transposase